MNFKGNRLDRPNTEVLNGRDVSAWWGVGVSIFIITVLFLWSPVYISHVLVMLSIYLLLAYSLNLVTGFCGLLVFCHASFYGIGAYAYALTRLQAGAPGGQLDNLLWTSDWGFFPGVIAGGAAGAVLAYGFGWLSLRFKEGQFAFATLCLQTIVFLVLYNWREFSGGPFGVYGIPRPALFSFLVEKPWHYLLLLVGFLVVLLPPVFRLYRSPFGLALKTMKEDERAAQSLAIDTRGLALTAMSVAGGLAGIAGALYASYITYIDPTSFSIKESIYLVTLLMLGGGGNAKGPLLGAIVMLALPELLRFTGLPDSKAANVKEIVYGSLLAALMFWRPQGLAGSPRFRS